VDKRSWCSEVSANPASPGPSVSESPARWEGLAFHTLSATVLAAVMWLFILQPTYHSTMVEYLFKFLPALTDDGLPAIFDGNGIGDPRSRLLANLLALANVHLRRLVLENSLLPPALGISWLLYPACLWLLFQVTRRLSGQPRIAMFAVLLYATSPALLDTLVNYYVPAKPLVNVMMLLALYGGCLLFPSQASSARLARGVVIVFLAGLLGLLSDETAIFIYPCVPLVFIDKILSDRVRVSTKILFFGALATSGVMFLLISFLALPVVNERLGQAPVDLWTVVTKGVNTAMFGSDSNSLGPLARQYSPFSLLETILSVHTVPGRMVNGVYTSSVPIPHFFQWRLREQLGLYMFIGMLVFLFLRLRRNRTLWALEWRLIAAFVLFVFGQGFLLLPLAPWIIETNYYAALASLFFSLCLSVVLGGWVSESHLRPVPWIFLTYLMLVQFANFEATAKRHPNFDGPPLTWGRLRAVQQQVEAGQFEVVAKAHPFPSRLFSWAFEHQVAAEHKAGRSVDIKPFSEPSRNLFRYIDMNAIAGIGYRDISLNIAAAQEERSLIEAGARRLEARWDLFANSSVEGHIGPWNYVRHFDSRGHVRQRYWRSGLMRAWADRGTVGEKHGEVCMSFEKSGEECIARVYDLHDVMFAFSALGNSVGAFRRKPGAEVSSSRRPA
jgi:hypothetical protein